MKYKEKMKYNIVEATTLTIAFLFLGFAIGGIVFQEGCIECEKERKYDGCWTQVKNSSWVCVNIKYMSYERAVEVCHHEVAHEIFAEECEDNITKCMEVINK